MFKLDPFQPEHLACDYHPLEVLFSLLGWVLDFQRLVINSRAQAELCTANCLVLGSPGKPLFEVSLESTCAMCLGAFQRRRVHTQIIMRLIRSVGI